MKLFSILLFFLLTIRAHTSDFSGSFLNLTAFQHYTNSIYNADLPDNYKNNLINLSRLKLYGTLDVSKFSSFNLSLQSDFLFKKEYYNILNYKFPETYQLHNSRINYWDNQYRSGTISIKELNYFHDFNFMKIKLGRQVIDWGFNRIWKVTDLFYPIYEPNYLNSDKPGVDAMSVDWIIDSTSSINMVVNFNNSITRFNYAGRYNHRNQIITFSAIIGYFDNKPIAGIELSKQLWNVEFRGEGLYSWNTQRKDSNQLSIMFGADYLINDKIKISVDYLVNGKGQNCKCSYNLIQIRDENITSLAKYYFAESLNLLITDKSKVTATLVQNINDNSGYIQLNTGYLISKNLSVDLAGMLSFGSQFDEFWYYPSLIYFALKYIF